MFYMSLLTELGIRVKSVAINIPPLRGLGDASFANALELFASVVEILRLRAALIRENPSHPCSSVFYFYPLPIIK